MVAEPQGNTQLAQRLSTAFSLGPKRSRWPFVVRTDSTTRYNYKPLGVAQFRARALAYKCTKDATQCAEGLHFSAFHFVSAALLSLVPLVYIIVVIIHHLIRRFRGEKGGDELTSSLPHRLLHSDQYRDSFGYVAVN